MGPDMVPSDAKGAKGPCRVTRVITAASVERSIRPPRSLQGAPGARLEGRRKPRPIQTVLADAAQTPLLLDAVPPGPAIGEVEESARPTVVAGLRNVAVPVAGAAGAVLPRIDRAPSLRRWRRSRSRPRVSAREARVRRPAGAARTAAAET